MLPGTAKGAEGRWGKEADLDALKEVLEQRAVQCKTTYRTEQLQENRFLCKTVTHCHFSFP